MKPKDIRVELRKLIGDYPVTIENIIDLFSGQWQYDDEARAGYLKLNNINIKVHRTESVRDNVNIDYDCFGHVIGIEILNI